MTEFLRGFAQAFVQTANAVQHIDWWFAGYAVGIYVIVLVGALAAGALFLWAVDRLTSMPDGGPWS